jgi:N-acetylglucosamine kinase-like BadF-type ATPase
LSRVFLGVDGGQSGTTALIGDEAGRVLGMGRGGPCNHVKGPGGRDKFVSAISGCVREACMQAGFGPAHREFHAACMGFSGGPADKQALVEQMFAIEKLTVTTDALIALSGATGGGPGIITIAGTGSIAYGRNAGGRTARAGGWGYLFGDEGGGFDITRQALRAVLRHDEGWGPATALREALLNATGAANPDELVHLFYTSDFPRPRIAGFSKLVDAAAAAGDAVSAEILHSAAQSLATIAAAVRRQLFPDGGAAPVAAIGGVFRSGRLHERFRMLVELDGGATVIHPRFGPAAGALLEAYQLAGLRPGLTGVPELEK